MNALQTLAHLIRTGQNIDKSVRQEIERSTGFSDYETTDPAELLSKLTAHIKTAQLGHQLVKEQTIPLPGAPKLSPPPIRPGPGAPKSREQELQDHLDQLVILITALAHDIYGISIDKDFVEKQISPRVLKTIARWSSTFITEKVPKSV